MVRKKKPGGQECGVNSWCRIKPWLASTVRLISRDEEKGKKSTERVTGLRFFARIEAVNRIRRNKSCHILHDVKSIT